MKTFLFITSILLQFIGANSNDVVPTVLTSSNFDQAINENVWMVKFYAPWCGHCQKLAPIYDELAAESSLKDSSIHIGKVDCTKDKPICQRFGVRSYPTLKVITNGVYYDYSGNRELESMLTYVKEGYKLEGEGEKILSLEEAQERREIEKKAKAITSMDEVKFKETIRNSPNPWIVKFYTSWCGHCKKLTPTWDLLVKKLHDVGSNTKVAQVNCEEEEDLCSTLKVDAYPTILYFNDNDIYEFQGQRTVEDLLEYVEKGWETALPVGELEEDGSILLEIWKRTKVWYNTHPIRASFFLCAVLWAIVGSIYDARKAKTDSKPQSTEKKKEIKNKDATSTKPKDE